MNRFFFLTLVISYVFAATYQATISDLNGNFANVNGGVFHVNDSVVVSTTGHNLVQLTSRTCGAIMLGGLQCCNITASNECNCPSNSFTLTFSTAGTYFFECAIPNHCQELSLLGQITFTNATTSSHHASSSHHATSSHHASSSHHATSSHHTTSSHHASSSQHKSGAERLTSGLNLLFVASFILFVKFIKIF